MHSCPKHGRKQQSSKCSGAAKMKCRQHRIGARAGKTRRGEIYCRGFQSEQDDEFAQMLKVEGERERRNESGGGRVYNDLRVGPWLSSFEIVKDGVLPDPARDVVGRQIRLVHQEWNR